MMRLTLALLAVGATALRVTQECSNGWFWNSCAAMRYRSGCAWEQESDCGYIWQDQDLNEFWATCDEIDIWIPQYTCSPCDENPWYWDECVGTWSRLICDVEVETFAKDGRLFYDLEWDMLYWWHEDMVQFYHD